jgi:hypothetical protein
MSNGLREQFPQLSTDGNAAGLPRLANGLVLAQDDGVGGPVNVGNRRPAEFAGARPALSQGRVNQPKCGTTNVA